MNDLSPRKEMLKLLSIPICLLLLSYVSFLAVRFDYDQEASVRTPNKFREPTNVAPDKEKAQLNKEVRAIKKPHGSLETEISSDTSAPLTKGLTTELVGYVKVERDLDQVDVVWHLPEGVEKISGDDHHIFLNLQAGAEQKVSIKIISHVDINKQIHLEASYMQGSEKLGSTSQFNTVDQANIDKDYEQKKLTSSRSNEENKIWQ